MHRRMIVPLLMLLLVSLAGPERGLFSETRAYPHALIRANRATLRYTPNCNATVLMVETTHRESGWRALYGKPRFQECPVD